MKSYRPSLSFAIILFLFHCSAAVADQIVLKNGDRVTGAVMKSDGKTLVLKADLIGEISLALENVTEISSAKPLYVVLRDGRTVLGVIKSSAEQMEIQSSSGAVSVNRSSIQFIRSEAEQKLYLNTLNPGWTEQWTGGADLGAALTKGNSNTTSVAFGLAMSRETLRDKTSVFGASVYNREATGGVSRTEISTIRFGVRYDRDFHKNWFGYVFSDLERNRLQQLNFRFVIGGGVGYHAIRNDRTKLDLLGGLARNREYFKGLDNDRTSAEAQVGQTLSHLLFSRVSLKGQLFFFPNLTRGGEYRINFDTSLVTDVSRRIGWHLTLSDRYLSNPPSGFKQNDLLLTTGVRLKLGLLK